MYGVLLVVVLVATGGAIAFIGDKLGTKVGKKRLSIFGMRPKHTSILVTIITGILITSSTIGVMALVSKNVRVALFGMERLNRQIMDTQTNLVNVSAQLQAAQKEREATVAALQKAQGDYKIAVRDLEKAQADYQAAREDLQQSREQVAALESTKRQLAEEKTALEERVASLSDEQAQLEGDIERLRVLTQRLSEGIQFVREGDILYRANEVIAMRVFSHENDQSAQEGLRDILAEANAVILKRLGIKENIEALWLSQPEYQAAVAKMDAFPKDMVVRVVAAGNIVYGEPVRAHIELFENARIYGKSEKIFSKEIAFDGDTGAAEQAVMEFLKEVNSMAAKKGIIPDPLSGTVGVMNGAQFYDIVHAIEPQKGTVRLTAYAQEDTNAFGPLRLRIKVEKIQENTDL